jgi:hypothetical protein
VATSITVDDGIEVYGFIDFKPIFSPYFGYVVLVSSI